MSIEKTVTQYSDCLFYFFRSGNKAKGGVEFRHSTHNASRIRQVRVSYTRFPLRFPLYAEYSVKQKIYLEVMLNNVIIDDILLYN